MMPAVQRCDRCGGKYRVRKAVSDWLKIIAVFLTCDFCNYFRIKLVRGARVNNRGLKLPSGKVIVP